MVNWPCTLADAHRRQPNHRRVAGRSALAVGACLVLFGAAGCSASSPGSPPMTHATATPAQSSRSPGATPPRAATTKVTKLLVVFIENRSFEQMSSQMPYVVGLARRYGYATRFHAIRHPSLPNYLAVAGGSTYGVTDDAPPASHNASGHSVFGDAIRAGKTATIYNDGMAGSCALRPQNLYAVKHNAWAYFSAERALCRGHDVSASSLDTDIATGRLPNAGEIVPNLCHDAHDLVAGCSLTEADTWLRGTLGKVIAGPDFRSGHLAVVVTADEDSYQDDNLVLTAVLHPSQHHHVVGTPLTHYSLSRLFSQVLGTQPLHDAATAPDMAAAFGLPIAGS
jgi:hypothetical protein